MKYRVRGALGGGFGGCENKDWEEVECEDENEASDIAYQIAIEEYEMYEGGNGIRSIDDIMDEEGVDEEEAEMIYHDERESWIDYEYELVE
jgi:hypothetical protein